MATVGQLKAVAKPFYDQLGLSYPWTAATSDDANNAPATLGQLKAVFKFAIPTPTPTPSPTPEPTPTPTPTPTPDPNDTDTDGLHDAWEIQYFGNLLEDGTGDYDADGISNIDEFLNGSHPGIPAPTAPANVRRTPHPDGSVTISWDDTSNNEDGFRIYRKNLDGSYDVLTEVGPNQTSVTLPPGSGL